MATLYYPGKAVYIALLRNWHRPLKKVHTLLNLLDPNFCHYTVICTLLLVFCPQVHAQNDTLYFRHFSVDQGLSHPNVSSIVQDSLGFMWYGTQDGLNKFDGYQFISFKHDPRNKNSLVSDDISCLAVENSGILWIGTKMKGINRFDPYTGEFTRFQQDDPETLALSDDGVNDLFADSIHHFIWVATNKGLNGYDLKTKKIRIYNNVNGNPFSLSNNKVTCLAQDKTGKLWIGTDGGGINSFDVISGIFTCYRHNEQDTNSISSDIVRDIFVDKINNVWVATPKYLNSLNPVSGRFKKYKHNDQNRYSISSDNITSVYQDKYGKIWAGTASDGLCVYYPTLSRFYRYTHEREIQNSLSSNKINSISQGRSGMFWAATKDGGLNAFNPKTLKFNLFNPVPGLEGENIYQQAICLLADEKQGLFIGTGGHGLYVYNPSLNRIMRYQYKRRGKPGISDNHINCLYQSPENKFWIGTDNGMDEFDPATGAFQMLDFYKFLPDKKRLSRPDSGMAISTIYQDHLKVIWIGTKAGGLYAYDTKNGITSFYSKRDNDSGSLSNDHITCLKEDKNGTMWIGTFGGGLNKFDRKEKKFNAFKNDNTTVHSIGSNYINSIYEDDLGKLWISTWGGGLNVLTPGGTDFISYTVQDGLPNNSMSAIMQDNNLNFWVGTDDGICRLTFLNNKLSQCRIFDLIDGLPTTAFYESSSFKERDGRMLFSCKKGLISFYPDSLRNNPYKPPVVITDFQLFNKSVNALDSTGILKTSISVTKEIHLAHNQNSFSFEFTAISFINAGKNKYAYKLEGFDKDWNLRSAQNRTATFTNLEPGAYIFRVKASNNDGIWNEQGASVKIIISAPLWKTWWFLLICILFAAALVYLLYRIRLQRILEMENIRSNIARDLHDDLGSTLSSVSILSQLAKKNAAKDSIATEDLIDRIGEHSQAMMNSMDEIVWSINPNNDNLKNISVRMNEYASEILEAQHINYAISIQENMDDIKIPMNHRRDFFLIFKEAINNLAKYSHCNNAQIRFLLVENELVLTIVDDGIGFNVQPDTTGNGLRNMQKRALILKGTLSISSKKGAGTVITLKIPLH